MAGRNNMFWQCTWQRPYSGPIYLCLHETRISLDTGQSHLEVNKKFMHQICGYIFYCGNKPQLVFGNAVVRTETFQIIYFRGLPYFSNKRTLAISIKCEIWRRKTTLLDYRLHKWNHKLRVILYQNLLVTKYSKIPKE